MDLKKLVITDQQFSRRIRISEERLGYHRAASFFAHSADSWYWIGGLAALWVFGPPGWKSTTALLLVSIFLTAVLVLILKFTVRRPRPEGLWGDFYRRSDPHSFPSGHAARAALLTAIMLVEGPLWLGGLMILWAGLVNYSRIALGVHYLSDILAGTALGLLLGWIFTLVWELLL
mgnify:CR=1 FL=1